MRQRFNRSKQKGVTLLGVLLAVVIASVLMSRYANVIADTNHRKAIEIQGQRLANVVNAVIRYQSSGGNPTGTPPVLSPLDQKTVSGAPWEDGAVHTGLDWLKDQTECGGAASAPAGFISCNVIGTPNLGENTIYRFVVENQSGKIETKIQIVQASDVTLGVLNRGEPDTFLAAAIASNAESKFISSAHGAANTIFDVTDRTNAIVEATVVSDTITTPYLRADGLTDSHSTQTFLDGIVVKNGIEVEDGIELKGQITDTTTPARFIDMDGNSSLENLTVVDLITQDATIDATYIDTDGADIDVATILDLNVSYINQTDPTVQNQIAGELKVGTAGSEVEIGNGNVGLDGVVYNRNDSSYFVDLTAGGTSRLDDIVLTSLGNRRISELMPKMSLRGTKQVGHGDLLPIPSCASTGTPRLLIDPIRWSTLLLGSNGIVNLDRNVNYIGAVINGSNWQISFTTHSQDDGSIIPDTNGLGLAQVYCYYP